MSEQLPGGPRPVLRKRDFVTRYLAGEFGNRSPTWPTLDEFMGDNPAYDHHARFHLRCRVAGGETHYGLNWYGVQTVWEKVGDAGEWDCSAMCPHGRNVLQGEVMRSETGLYLYGSRAVGLPMREALRAGAFHAHGLTALGHLRSALNPAGAEWLEYLLDAYPGHVVEFTALDGCWGTEPGHNTLIWEVRNY